MIFGDMHRVRRVFNGFPFKPLIDYTMGVMNASIAAYAMNIAAEACGVASVMLSDTGKTGFYDCRYLKDKLELPEGVLPVMTIVLGYPKRTPLGMPPKLPMEEIVFSGKYREPDRQIAEEWLEQMRAGYLTLGKSFNAQVKHYTSRIHEVERDLREMVYYKPEEYT
jgi:hypothetical protein